LTAGVNPIGYTRNNHKVKPDNLSQKLLKIRKNKNEEEGRDLA